LSNFQLDEVDVLHFVAWGTVTDFRQ